MNYYETLEITQTSTLDEIKKSYKRLSLLWHPDRHSLDKRQQAESKFKEISHAYQILSDVKLRSDYDNSLSQSGSSAGSRRERERGSRRRSRDDIFHGDFDGFAFKSPEELYKEFFSDMRFMNGSSIPGMKSNMGSFGMGMFDDNFVNGFGMEMPSLLSSFHDPFFTLGSRSTASTTFPSTFSTSFFPSISSASSNSSNYRSIPIQGIDGARIVSTSTSTSIINGVKTSVTRTVDELGNVTETKTLSDGSVTSTKSIGRGGGSSKRLK